MSKHVWRNWMNIFSAGKKVSEQNLVIEENTEVSDKVNKLESIGLSGKNVSNPIRMLQEIKNEPIYDDFLQYITMCGPLNFRLVAPDKWHAVKNIIRSDKSLSHINSDDY